MASAREELIDVFLGHPQRPTHLGHEIIQSSDEDVASRIASLFRYPSSKVATLEAVIQQSGTTPAQFAASQQALVMRIHEWRRQAVVHAASGGLDPRRSRPQEGRAPGRYGPPELHQDQRDLALLQILADQLAAGSLSPSEGAAAQFGAQRYGGLPPLDATNNSHCMSTFLRSVAVGGGSDVPMQGDTEDHWARIRSPLRRSFETQTPSIIRGGARRPHFEGAPDQLRRYPRSPYVTEEPPRNILPIPDTAAGLGRQHDAMHRVPSNSSAMMTARDQPVVMRSQAQDGGRPTTTMRTVSSTSSCDARSPMVIRRDSSPFYVGRGSLAPQSSPLLCPSGYLARNCFDYDTPIDMLREVSHRLVATSSEDGGAWGDGPATPNPVASSGECMSHSERRRQLQPQQQSSLIEERGSPPVWQTPARLTVTSSIGDCSSTGGWSSGTHLAGRPKLGCASSIQASGGGGSSTRGTKRGPIRPSLDSVETRASSSWAAWSSTVVDCDDQQSTTATPPMLKTAADVEAYVSQHVAKLKELEKASDPQAAKIMQCYAFLGFRNPNAVLTSHEVTRASQGLMRLIGLALWTEAATHSPGQEPAPKRTDATTTTPSMDSRVQLLPDLYDAVSEACRICTDDVRSRYVARFEFKTERTPGKVDPWVALNLGLYRGSALPEDMIRYAAAMADVEAFHCREKLGSDACVRAIRQQIYEAVGELLSSQQQQANLIPMQPQQHF